MRLEVDGGRESRAVPISIVKAGKAKSVPSTLVLGAVTINGNHAESSFHARLTVYGEALPENTVVVKSMPTMLKNPRVSVVGPTEVQVEFEIAPEGLTKNVRGQIRLHVISSKQDITQTLDVPVIGLLRRQSSALLAPSATCGRSASSAPRS